MSFTVGWDFMRKRDLKSIYKESMPTEKDKCLFAVPKIGKRHFLF